MIAIHFHDVAILERRGRLVLGPIELTLGPGAHAFVGARSAGGPLLLAALAGAVRLERGTVSLTFAPPAANSAAPRVVWVRDTPRLPPRLTAKEHLDAMTAVRDVSPHEPRRVPRNATKALEAHGLGALAARRIDTLDEGARRALALVDAVTSSADAILLDEPLTRVDPRAEASLVDALRARARGQADYGPTAVVVATASSRDAASLGAKRYVLHGGLCLAERELAAASGEASFRVGGTDLAALQAALLADTQSEPLDVFPLGGALVVRGPSPQRVARAIATAVVASGAEVDLIEPEVLA